VGPRQWRLCCQTRSPCPAIFAHFRRHKSQVQKSHISGVTSHKCNYRSFQVSQVTSAIFTHFRCHKSQVQLRDLCFVCVAGRHLTYRALYACTTCETWSELLLGVPRSLSSHTRLERPLKPSLILYAWQGVMTLTRPLL
jgi:hypothetical protein